MKMADHVGISAIRGHFKLLRVPLDIRKANPEERVLTDDAESIFPDHEPVLSAGIIGVEPTHLSLGAKPQSSGEYDDNQHAEKNRARSPAKLHPDHNPAAK